MNFRSRMQAEPTGIAIAPMVDVVFLLLIFFLMTWNFARYETELDVKVPTASEGKEVRRSVGEVIINVRRDGSIVLNRQTIDESALTEKLKAIVKQFPDQAVILRGDRESNYESIIKVLDICRAAEIFNIAFAAGKSE